MNPNAAKQFAALNAASLARRAQATRPSPLPGGPTSASFIGGALPSINQQQSPSPAPGHDPLSALSSQNRLSLQAQSMNISPSSSDPFMSQGGQQHVRQRQPQQQQQQPQQQTPSPFSQSTANTAAPAPGFGAFGAPAPHVGSDLFRAPIGFGASSSFGSGPSPSGLFGGSSFGTAATYANNAFGGAASTFGTSAPSAEVSHAATAPPPEDDVLSAFEEITGPGPFSEPATVVTESPLSVSYAVEGKSTIPSDGVAHQVSVAVLSFDSKVTHVCCPKIEARVYLQVGGI